MTRVAVLCEYPTLLGGERSWLAALPAIQKEGFVPAVFAPANGPLAEKLAELGLDHIDWSVHDSFGQRRNLTDLREELYEKLARLQPALVHANSLSMTRLAAPVIRELEAPSLGHLRDILRLSSAAVRDINSADRLLAVSEATRRFHVAQGIDADRVQVLYNGVDLKMFHDQRGVRIRSIVREMNLSEPLLLVAAIGQIGLRKGTDVFVKLAEHVLAERRDVHFLVVGERTSGKAEAVQLEAALREEAALPLCRGHVHFLGMRQDVADLLPQVDLVVHAARQEPLGRVLLESAAAGKAIVATDVGGTREIFSPDSMAAVLVPPCEADEVAESDLLRAAQRLLANRAERELLGLAARERAEAQFDAQKTGANLVRHYQALVQSG